MGEGAVGGKGFRGEIAVAGVLAESSWDSVFFPDDGVAAVGGGRWAAVRPCGRVWNWAGLEEAQQRTDNSRDLGRSFAEDM